MTTALYAATMAFSAAESASDLSHHKIAAAAAAAVVIAFACVLAWDVRRGHGGGDHDHEG